MEEKCPKKRECRDEDFRVIATINNVITKIEERKEHIYKQIDMIDNLIHEIKEYYRECLMERDGNLDRDIFASPYKAFVPRIYSRMSLEFQKTQDKTSPPLLSHIQFEDCDTKFHTKKTRTKKEAKQLWMYKNKRAEIHIKSKIKGTKNNDYRKQSKKNVKNLRRRNEE